MKTIQMNFECSQCYVIPSMVATTTKLSSLWSSLQATHAHIHTHFYLPHDNINSL